MSSEGSEVGSQESGVRSQDSRKNVRPRLIIVFLLGALTVTGFAPFHLFPVPVITLALLFRLWRGSATPLRAALLGFCFGLGLFGAGVSWIYVSLHDFGAMPLPLAALATFLFCAFLALFPALVGWMLTKLRLATPAFAHPFASTAWALAAAALWMLSEWVRGWIFTGFPWLALGYSQGPVSPLAGFAPVAGVYGVSLGLALSAAFLCLWFEQGWRTRRAVLSFVLPLVAIFSIGFGLQQIEWTTPQGEPVTVSLLQGNIPQDLKWQADRVINSMEVYAKLAQQSNSRLIIMPETALPLFRDQASPAYLARLADHARQNNGDILIGMPEYVPSGSGGEYYNTLFSFGASADQHYRKHHLVPFGEFIPLKPVFGWIIHVLQIPLSDFSRGGLDQKPLALAGQMVAVNICYEDVFGEEIISQLPAATLLVNVSNDAWFGRSIGPQQHLQISQMRALETGRYMLRATNTGVTAIINQRGVVLQEAEAFAVLALHGTAQGYGGATPYVRFGNSLALGLAGLLLLIGLFPVMSAVYRGTRKNL